MKHDSWCCCSVFLLYVLAFPFISFPLPFCPLLFVFCLKKICILQLAWTPAQHLRWYREINASKAFTIFHVCHSWNSYQKCVLCLFPSCQLASKSQYQKQIFPLTYVLCMFLTCLKSCNLIIMTAEVAFLNSFLNHKNTFKLNMTQ